ncbi:hypothetical protein D3C87_1865610 [compost metagenome]
MAGHELGEGIDHRDDRLAEIAVLHAGGAPEATRAGHVAAMGGGAGTIGRHGWYPRSGAGGAGFVHWPLFRPIQTRQQGFSVPYRTVLMLSKLCAATRRLRANDRNYRPKEAQPCATS